jgi:hypothetical protein
MKKPGFSFPDTDALEKIIDSILSANEERTQNVSINDRRPPSLVSTNPCEIVTFDIDRDCQRDLFFKYSECRKLSHGSRGVKCPHSLAT